MNTADLEYVSCDLCGTNNPKLLFATLSGPDGQGGGIVRCRECGLVYRNVRRTNTAEQQEYIREDYSTLSPDWIAGRQLVFERYLDRLDPLWSTNRILDVGAGHGFFLSLCAGRGWDCYGVELSPEAVAFAKREFGLSLHCSTLEETKLPDSHFDVLTFWNSLDHLPSPTRALKEAHRLLRPGGILMARFPNATFHIPAHRFFRLGAQLHRKLATYDWTIFHLYAFNRSSITRMMKKTGFTHMTVNNAPLSWTGKHSEAIGVGKRLASSLVYRISQALAIATVNTALVAPSLFVTAKK